MKEYEIPFVLGFVLLVACAWIVHWLSERKRSQSFAQLAKELYFDFVEEDSIESIPDHEHFPLLNHGHHRGIINKMYSLLSNNEPVIFGYKYTVGSGKNSTTFKQTVGWFAHRKPLPVFQLTPENILHKIAEAFGSKDIDFHEHPLFSKNYQLQGDDINGQISNLFSDSVLDYFERNKGLSLESGPSGLLIYFADRRLSADEIPVFIKQLKNIQSLFNSGFLIDEIDAEINPQKAMSPITTIYALIIISAFVFLGYQVMFKNDRSSTKTDDIEFSLGSGYAAYEGKDYDKAIKLYSKYIGKNQNNKEGYYYRALAYLRQEKNQLALNDFIKSTELDGSYFDAYLYIDQILAKELRFEEITRHWDRYMQNNNNNARAYLERGGAFLHAGNTEKAERDVIKACELGEQYACDLSDKF